MLGFDDPRWKELLTAYGSAADVLEKFRRLLEQPSWKDGRLDDPDDLLYGSLCHQGTVYTATFAAVPHFIELARRLEPRKRLDLLIFAGDVEEGRGLPDAAKLPVFLSRAYDHAVEMAGAMAHADLAQPWDGMEFRYLLGAYAALRGFRGIASVISTSEELDSMPETRVGYQPSQRSH